MTPTDCRITIRRRTARWDPDAEVTAAEAMDFWAFAAGAANVVMQLSWPQVVRQGGSYLLLADVRRRVRTHRALV